MTIENLMAQGRIIYFTGPPASGKTTLAAACVARLRWAGVSVLWLDSDDLRSVLTPNATYSWSERDFFYNALHHIARCACEGGVTVVISATAARRVYRERLRESVPEGAFVEVYLECDLPTLKERDPKQLYARAERGDIQELPGLGVPYEVPLNPEVTLPTHQISVVDAIKRLFSSEFFATVGKPLSYASENAPNSQG